MQANVNKALGGLAAIQTTKQITEAQKLRTESQKAKLAMIKAKTEAKEMANLKKKQKLEATERNKTYKQTSAKLKQSREEFWATIEKGKKEGVKYGTTNN